MTAHPAAEPPPDVEPFETPAAFPPHVDASYVATLLTHVVAGADAERCSADRAVHR